MTHFHDPAWQATMRVRFEFQNMMAEAVGPERGFTEAELLRWRNRFYRSFYCRPITLYRHLQYISRPRDLRKYLRALGLIAHLFFGKQ